MDGAIESEAEGKASTGKTLMLVLTASDIYLHLQHHVDHISSEAEFAPLGVMM